VSDSPFLQSLLRGIERNAEADKVVLEQLVFRTVTIPVSGFRSLDVNGVELFPLTKGKMFRFLRQSGLERWHTSTWLKFDAAGELESDVGMAININGPETDARLLQLTEKVWLNMSVGHPPGRLDDGTVLMVFREQHLVTLLEVARDIARRNPDWAAAQAQSAMRHVISDASAKSKRNNHRPGGTRGSRP
tara:strand:- start:1277 stop:1846 length:570 start_codon:yes stop_codon:yes gene_type:complete